MWMKIDDKLHAHRKTRAVLRSGPKRRDAGPMGLWVISGSWSADAGTDGWVPIDELDRWDDDWESLADRLVKSGYWWPEQRAGEPGYGFVDWGEWNTSRERQSESGRFGNHDRWHVKRGIVKLDCEFCPVEPPPDEPIPEADSDPDIGGESGTDREAISPPDSGANRVPDSENVAMPDPTRPDTQPKRTPSSAAADAAFETWWSHYPRKVDKGHARKAYRTAAKKTDHETLLAAAQAFAASVAGTEPRFVAHAATWLNGERWADQGTKHAGRVRTVDGRLHHADDVPSQWTPPGPPKPGQTVRQQYEEHWRSIGWDADGKRWIPAEAAS